MNLSNFAERLTELMFDAKKNTTQLSAELECGESTISRYATGKSFPTVEMTVRLADYFHCTCDYLLGIEEENHAQHFKSCPPFGERLLAVCEFYKISRYQLQKLTHISESVMRYWVRGKTQPSIVNVVKIAEKLNCTVDFVLGRES